MRLNALALTGGRSLADGRWSKRIAIVPKLDRSVPSRRFLRKTPGKIDGTRGSPQPGRQSATRVISRPLASRVTDLLLNSATSSGRQICCFDDACVRYVGSIVNFLYCLWTARLE